MNQFMFVDNFNFFLNNEKERTKQSFNFLLADEGNIQETEKMNSIIFTFIIIFLEIYLTKEIQSYMKALNHNETNDINTIIKYLKLHKESIISKIRSEDILVYMKLAVELNFMTYFDEEKVYYYLKNSIRFEKFPLRYINEKLVFETEKKIRNDEVFTKNHETKCLLKPFNKDKIATNSNNRQLAENTNICNFTHYTHLKPLNNNNSLNNNAEVVIEIYKKALQFNIDDANDNSNNHKNNDKEAINQLDMKLIIDYYEYNSFVDVLDSKIVTFLIF